YEQAMRPGDVLKVDIGVVYRGWVGDAGWTYVFKEYPSEDVRRLMQCGKESLARGAKQLRPGNTFRAWAAEIEACAQRDGFHIVENLGGHGIGRWNRESKKGLHEPPFVPNTPGASEANSACVAGTLIAVEPMLALGTAATRQADRTWPVLTADGSIAVHYEHDV